MKKTALLILTLLAFLLVLFTSCTNDIDAPDCSWDEVFLQYWNAMNTEYVHFSEDASYDWDKVYEEYLPKFKALDYTKAEDSIKAFKYFKEIAVGAHDNHYNLTVKDGLGNTLATSPAMLTKYAAAGGDIMDFPDVKIAGLLGESLVTINNPDNEVSAEALRKIYKQTIPSIFEVENLIKGKDITDEEATGGGGDATYGYFHSTDGDIATEFPDGAYYGYTFVSFTKEEIAKFDEKEDQIIAAIWNYVIKELGIESYFYGVNKDNIFYLYFSDFGNPLYLTDLFTKEEADLTPEEKELIANNSDIKNIRFYTRWLFDDAKDIKDEDLKAKIEKGLGGIIGIQKMYATLNSVVSKDEWAVSETVTKNDFKGVIVDLRGNGGGAVAFLSSIWGLFFKDETQFGYVRYKAGYSRLEYTPWTSFSIAKDYTNEELEANYAKPVAVIANGYSVSCSEISCVIAKLLEKSAIVGHTTFGGTCALSDRTVFNSGPFTSEHLNIYTTTYQFVNMEKKSFETTGIEPDIATELDPKKDNAYIAAVDWVKTR